MFDKPDFVLYVWCFELPVDLFPQQMLNSLLLTQLADSVALTHSGLHRVSFVNTQWFIHSPLSQHAVGYTQCVTLYTVVYFLKMFLTLSCISFFIARRNQLPPLVAIWESPGDCSSLLSDAYDTHTIVKSARVICCQRALLVSNPGILVQWNCTHDPWATDAHRKI